MNQVAGLVLAGLVLLLNVTLTQAQEDKCDIFAGSICDRVTAGGRLDGANGRAAVSVIGDGCNPPNFEGRAQYKDFDGGQKFNGEVVFARQCLIGGDCPVCDPLRINLGFPLTLADYEVRVDYKSTNPAFPGEGTATLCFTDADAPSGSGGPDTAIIQVQSGPYAGYLNHGPIRGNVQQLKCEE